MTPRESITRIRSWEVSKIRRRSSVCCRSVARVLLASVMSRATFDMPMVSPDGALIGDMLSETSTGVPSLRMRTVSFWSIRSPQPIRRMVSSTSVSRSGGTMSAMFFPDGLRRAIAVQALGGQIPAGDGAVERLRDDGVVGRFDRGAEQALALRMVVARGFGAAMLLDLALERGGFCLDLFDHPGEGARQHAGLAARIDRNGGCAVPAARLAPPRSIA